MKFKLYTDDQALKYAFNMKYQRVRTACWLSLLAESDFELCNWAEKQNDRAYYLSGPVGVLIFLKDQSIEADMLDMANYLHSLKVIDSTTRYQKSIKFRARVFYYMKIASTNEQRMDSS